MFRRLFLMSTAVVLCTLSAARAQPDPEQSQHNEAWGYRGKLLIVPSLIGGIVVGKTADNFTSIKDKALYGAGIALEHYVHPKVAVALNFDVVWKNMSQFDENAIRTFDYAAYLLFRAAPYSRQSAFFRLEGGISTTSVSYGPDLKQNLGTHGYLRLGFGLYSQYKSAAGISNSRVEIYYRITKSEGSRDYYIPHWRSFNAAAVGIELAVGVPL